MTDISHYFDEFPPISLRRIGQLILRAWPYMKPLVRHVLFLMGTGGLAALLVAGAALVATDIFNNKILVGDKLQPLQAAILFVDSSYVTHDIEDNVNEADSLTAEQRKVVRNHTIIWALVLGVVLIPIGTLLFYYNIWIWQMINQNLRVAMMTKAEHLSLRFHAQSRVGDAIFRIYKDSSTITSLIQSAVVGPVMQIYGILTGLVFIAFFDPRIAVACVVVIIPMVIVTAVMTPQLRFRALANRVTNSDLLSRLQESMTALKVVKANQGEKRILDRFHTDSRNALDAALYMRMTVVVLDLVTRSLSLLLIIATEYIIVVWVLDERETFLGAAVATLIGYAVWNLGAFQDARGRLTGTMFESSGLVRRWALLQDLFIGLERAFYLLDLEPEVVDPASPVPFPDPITEIQWRDVHFSYEGSLQILKGVDLTARVGTITAIVGSSGAGKSTLMSLLLRLYDPDQGAVLINGTDLREMRVQDVRDNTAIALQRNVLFAATVADNISYAVKNVSRSDVVAAARVACADDFIDAMEQGYDTELGERGGKLSTGQRQRLSLARAIVRNTPVLVLDEPTASLDAETELAVMNNLAVWGKDRIVFLITHRLSTIRNADQIAFLEDGHLKEVGTHEELLARPGRYAAFFDASLQSGEVSHDE
ncbi:MAG: ABC transporter ATP-binding protein [Proteobacteria bacterium]|nr:ABC transporter ATP-binding protein [Pseudomonadota bacterium]MDA1298797.1 ABC transporter ATP-binding protein [Pseudomonadota bacterium]